MKLETVEVYGQQGDKLIINKKDFDESKHELYGSKEVKKQVKKPKRKPIKNRD